MLWNEKLTVEFQFKFVFFSCHFSAFPQQGLNYFQLHPTKHRYKNRKYMVFYNFKIEKSCRFWRPVDSSDYFGSGSVSYFISLKHAIWYSLVSCVFFWIVYITVGGYSPHKSRVLGCDIVLIPRLYWKLCELMSVSVPAWEKLPLNIPIFSNHINTSP